MEMRTLDRPVLTRTRFSAEISEAVMQSRRCFIEADQRFVTRAAQSARPIFIANAHATAPENGGCPSSNMSSVERNAGIRGL
jgi:hypothetical protein